MGKENGKMQIAKLQEVIDEGQKYPNPFINYEQLRRRVEALKPSSEPDDHPPDNRHNGYVNQPKHRRGRRVSQKPR